MTNPPPETPRTDEAEGDAYEFQHNLRVVPASFSRQLERDLSAALARAERAEVERKELEHLRIAYDGTVRLAQRYRERAEAAEARVSALGAALRELVRLKDLKDRLDEPVTGLLSSRERIRLDAEYTAKKPLAWQVARSLTKD